MLEAFRMEEAQTELNAEAAILVAMTEVTIPAVMMGTLAMAAVRTIAATLEVMIPAETPVMAKTWNGRTIISKREIHETVWQITSNSA